MLTNRILLFIKGKKGKKWRQKMEAKTKEKRELVCVLFGQKYHGGG